MLDNNNATKIKANIQGLETVTRFSLAILALASGVYTYLGVRSLLDGSSMQIFFAAFIYASAVSVGIYAFWTYLMKFVPLMTDGTRRLALFATMAVGSVMIIAMSSWLNAAALAGSAATEQHLAQTLEDYSTDLDKAHSRALAAQSLLPDVLRASERFKRLASEEQTSGALTGTSGAGTVVQLLQQMGGQLDELSVSISGSKDKTANLFDAGRDHLSKMRSLVSAPGAVQPRADQFSTEAVALAGVISQLQETSIAPSVRRAAQDLSLGFIAPVADGSSDDLASRQNQIIDTVRQSVDAQSTALADAADEIMAVPAVPTRRFVPLSSAEAVLIYASDFAPSWAGAISIDLLPAILVLILSVAYSAIRADAQILEPAEKLTAAEMMRAVSIYKSMTGETDARSVEETQTKEDEPPASQPQEDATVIRPVDLHQRKRIEDSRK